MRTWWSGFILVLMVCASLQAQEMKEFRLALPAGKGTGEAELLVPFDSSWGSISRNFGLTQADAGLAVWFVDEHLASGAYKLKVALRGEISNIDREAVVWLRVAEESAPALRPPLPPKTFRFKASPPQNFQIFTHVDDRGLYEKPAIVHCRISEKSSGSVLFSGIYPLQSTDEKFPISFAPPSKELCNIEFYFSDRFGRASGKCGMVFSGCDKP